MGIYVNFCVHEHGNNYDVIITTTSSVVKSSDFKKVEKTFSGLFLGVLLT